MGQFGFSWMGLIFLLLLFIPNLIWTKYQPSGDAQGKESRLLRGLEKTGQVCVTSIVLFFSDFNPHSFTPWTLWLIGALALMALYECFWIRYFKSSKTLYDFYASFLGIPVAGASLPVAAFICLGIYGKVLWLPLAAVILGIGHIGIHLGHYRELSNEGSRQVPPRQPVPSACPSIKANSERSFER